MIYQWREDSRIGGDAQVVGERLSVLANGAGRVTPDIVLTDASDEQSPLHRYFDWNDGSAANKYRLWQARALIGAVMVVREEISDPVRAFVNLTVVDDQAYRSLDTVLSDADMRKQMLAAALTELNSIKKRYAQLKELASVFSSIDRVRADASIKHVRS